MKNLFLAIIKYKTLILFVGLELLCAFFIVQNNAYQSTAYFTSANSLVGGVYQKRNDVQNFVGLTLENERLAAENAALKRKLANLQTAVSSPLGSHFPLDSGLLQRYAFEPAQVINNSFLHENNHLTLNKGTRHGIKPGMGIITPLGAVGKIKATSDNFSTAFSILHSEISVSAMIKGLGTLCTIKWEGKDYTKARLTFVARHIKLHEGDTLVTSGVNMVFPKHTPMGVISFVDTASSNRYNEADVLLFNDFSKLDYVYVFKDSLKQEQDSLETLTLQL